MYSIGILMIIMLIVTIIFLLYSIALFIKNKSIRTFLVGSIMGIPIAAMISNRIAFVQGRAGTPSMTSGFALIAVAVVGIIISALLQHILIIRKDYRLGMKKYLYYSVILTTLIILITFLIVPFIKEMF